MRWVCRISETTQRASGRMSLRKRRRKNLASNFAQRNMWLLLQCWTKLHRRAMQSMIRPKICKELWDVDFFLFLLQTPTAHAAASISVFLDSFSKMPWKEVINLLSSWATIDAIWTKGPSLPSGIPEPKVAVSPITFATSVLKVRYSFRATPRKIVFISGIPEPA